MTTSYPPGLPPVPDDHWNTDRLDDLGVDQPDEGPATTVSRLAVDASDAAEAELRLLAYVSWGTSPGADLRGMTATAISELTPGRWSVELRVPGEY